MADKRISQLVERVTLANNDVFPIVASGATTTNKVTLQTIDDYMQTNLDFGVTSVAMTVPTGLSVTGTPVTSTGTFVVTFTAGYSIPTNAKQTQWDTAYTNRITSATAPLGIASNVISITQSGASSNGYLSSTDWNTFNNKQNALTFGNLTEDTTNVLIISGGTGAVIGSGTSIEVRQASSTQGGYLSSADWSTFNGKQNALSGTGIVKSTGGTITYLTDNTSNWDSAYNDKINSASVTGTTTKTLTLNQQDGGTITTTWTDLDTGTVTSVGVTMPSAFSVANSPITSSGTIAITGAGTISQYIDGTGALRTFPSIIAQATNLVREVYNESGATMTKGTVVYINGGHGNLPTIAKALATGDATSAQTYGVVQSNIGDQSNGYIVVVGDLIDMDTQAYLEGTQLYLSPTTAGEYTSTKQYAPNHLVYVGIVTRSHPTQGIIAVKIQNGYEMDELHNVSAQSPNNNDILQYKTATGLWTKTAGTTSNIAEGSNLYYTDARSRAAISESVTGLDYNSSTGVLSTTTGYAIPTTASQTNWDAAYNDKINSAAVTGTTTKTLTLTQQDGGTITASWTDINTDAVSSVFGRTGAVVATSGDYNTDQVTEGSSNLYFTNARSRSSITLTTTGTSGAASYNSTTGVLNIPSYVGGVTSVNTLTGAVVLTTSNIAEGTNLYYTDTRARAAISLTTTGTSGVATYSGGTINIPNYTYTLPTASTSVLGGVKVDGTTITINGSGVISGANTYTLPVATASVLGGVKIGTGVSVDVNGVISVSTNYQAPITLTTTGTSGAATFIGNTLNIPNYSTDLSGYVTLATAQTITGVKTFNNSGVGTIINATSNWTPSVSNNPIITFGRTSSAVAGAIGYDDSQTALYIGTTTAHNFIIKSGNTIAGTFLNTGAGIFSSSITASSIIKSGGTSSQFLKADGSVDSNTYLTSYTETDTLASVTGRGATTATALTLTATDSSLTAQSNGTGNTWRGRIVAKNSTANIATFIGNYNSRGGVFGHTNALDGWNDLWVNTLGTSGDGKVHLSNNTVVHASTSDTEYAIIHAGNVASYALPVNGDWIGNTGMNDQKLYLRTNGDNNHYLWNAADDWEELVYYTGTGFRIKGSTGITSATFADGGMSTRNITGTGTDFYFGDWLSKRIKWFGVSGADYKHKYILLMRVPTFGNTTVNCAIRGKLILERTNGIGIDVHDEFQVTASYGNNVSYSMINKCIYGTSLVNYTHGGVQYLALYVYSAPNYGIGMLEVNLTDFGSWLDANFGLVVELNSANHTSATFNRLEHRFNGSIIAGYGINTAEYNVLTENQLYRTGGGNLFINSSGTGHVRMVEGGGSLLINTGTKWNQEKLGVQISNAAAWASVPAMMRLTNYGSGYRTKITFTDSSIIDGWLGMIPINNGSYFVMGFSGATEEGFKVYQNGNVVAAGDVTAYSDARLKTNVVTIDNALNKVMSLRGVNYNRIDTQQDKTKIGLIAQEVQSVLPEVVDTDNEGMLSVSYGNIVSVLIEAMKEQQKQIEELKNIVNAFTK